MSSRLAGIRPSRAASTNCAASSPVSGSSDCKYDNSISPYPGGQSASAGTGGWGGRLVAAAATSSWGGPKPARCGRGGGPSSSAAAAAASALALSHLAWNS
ncbi:hypothetical protein Vafri_16634 [Volvox africanus]|uniref:Uncharacterized protein n=1 Tax=Volvox africanus TaxID=51714 RepID=A0A8J4BP35_9CHLO|nr:hypothetical protein Vafri_16634 [Volvox africanus]